MGWFGKPQKNAAWSLTEATPPWSSGTSIYAHIRQHLSQRGDLTEEGERLPDEQDDGRMKFVAGGLDGAFGHHWGGGGDKTRAKMLYRALQVVLEDPAPSKLEKLYDQLMQQGALEFIDPLIEQIIKTQELDRQRLAQLGEWIAQNAPHREPVKFAIAMLGIAGSPKHHDLLLTLGKHEEFTLYVSVALANIGGDDAENKLFELAKHVHGWGRISVVERLAETQNPTIKAWMLCEGYKNSIMYEYLAYRCAVTGGLREELEKSQVDSVLLAGAGEIIQALIMGGPAEEMDDYPDGAVVVERYLEHLGGEPRQLQQLLVVDSIDNFLHEEDADIKARAERGWTPKLRDKLSWKIRAIKELPHWKQMTREGLDSPDDSVYYKAHRAARILGIDPWEHDFARLASGLSYALYHVMQTDDPARIDRVVSWAETFLPLNEIATGPAKERGLGLEWKNHGHLDDVLQGLRRFPGKGWPFIRAGLRSPVIRNRHMALRALSPWGKENWPAGASMFLVQALEQEPDDEVRDEIATLLEGKQIVEPD